MFAFTDSSNFYAAAGPDLTSEQLAAINRFVPFSTNSALAAATRLRTEGFSSTETAAILEQAKLRTRAATKFGGAAQNMLLTQAGYEQASRCAVSRLHARRLRQSGITALADLGCGIGGDSLAFARVGLSVTAVELDPVVASFASYNLRNFPDTEVWCGDLQSLDLEQLNRNTSATTALWLDPARREVQGGKTGVRLFDPEAFSPSLSWIRTLAETGIALGVKMSPGLPHEMIPDSCEAQWVSQGGTLLETVLWFNALARPGIRRSATVLGRDPLQADIIAELTSQQASSDPAETGPLQEYLLEPDSALIRSHLLTELADLLGAHLLDERIAYLTSARPISHPAVSSYRVLETMPLNIRTLKNWVQTRNIGALTIKKRGVDIVPEQLRTTLLAGRKKHSAQKGAQPATLILTRLGAGADSQRVALHVEPL